MRRQLEYFDRWFIGLLKQWYIPFGRFAMFLIFFWFGILKIIGTSSANPLVQNLMERTLPFITFDTFIILFSIYEMIIGITFILPKCERLAIALLIPHMVMTSLPLFLLPAVAWQSFLTPTLEGQYIIKNLVLIGLAMSIAAHLHPMHLSLSPKLSRGRK